MCPLALVILVQDLVAAGWETYGVVNPPSMDNLMSMLPSLTTLHSQFWEAPILKTFPVTLIECEPTPSLYESYVM